MLEFNESHYFVRAKRIFGEIRVTIINLELNTSQRSTNISNIRAKSSPRASNFPKHHLFDIKYHGSSKILYRNDANPLSREQRLN